MSDFDNLQIRKVDGGLLLIFQELLKRGRASEVAHHLGLSPSAISHALTRLRDIFGDPLFIRRSHGLEPTARAVALGPKVEALIDLIGATVSARQAFDPARTRRRFQIAAMDHITSLIAPGLAGAFGEFALRATFAIRPVILQRALAAVRRGELDLAIGVFSDLPPGLRATPLYEDDYCVLARQGHPLIDGAIDLIAYATIGHIFVGNPDGALSDETPMDRALIEQTYGPMPRPSQVRTYGYVTAWESAMLAASVSDALVDCPRRLAMRYAGPLGLQILEPPYTPFKLTIQAVRRTGEDDGVDWLLEQLAAAVG